MMGSFYGIFFGHSARSFSSYAHFDLGIGSSGSWVRDGGGMHLAYQGVAAVFALLHLLIFVLILFICCYGGSVACTLGFWTWVYSTEIIMGGLFMA